MKLYDVKESESEFEAVDFTQHSVNMGWVTTIAIADIPVVIKKLAAFIPEPEEVES